MSAAYHSESQRLRQPWLWGFLLLVGVPSAALVLTTARGDGEWLGAVAFFGVYGGVLLLFAAVRFTVSVESDALALRYFPIHRRERRVPWEEVDAVEREPNPATAFGGWGVRWRPGAWGYVADGGEGVWIRREERSDLLVGTADADALLAAIERARDPR